MAIVTDTATEVLSPSALKALEEFEALPCEEYLDVWKTLPPPTFTEVNGEYAGRFASGYSQLHKDWERASLKDENGPQGYWECKAYTPLGPVSGEGYNVWRMPDGSIQRRNRFATHLGCSLVDGGLSLVMTYAAFNRKSRSPAPGLPNMDPAWTGNLLDEIRKLEDGVYIGCAHLRLDAFIRNNHPAREMIEDYGFTIPKTADAVDWTERSPFMPGIFVLTGPVRPCVGVDDPTIEDQ